MRDSLSELRAMTETLPAFPPEVVSQGKEHAKIHKMARGTSIAWDLLTQDEISVARWFNSASTIFPEHAHEQREWIICYVGSIMLHIEGAPPKRLLPGMSAVIEPRTRHRASFSEDCWYLAITVPSTKDWPGTDG